MHAFNVNIYTVYLSVDLILYRRKDLQSLFFVNLFFMPLCLDDQTNGDVLQPTTPTIFFFFILFCFR
uniref:Uncharacterized protein n=1 Tax=Caenorhabditis japonica TaxID=281687 RepID=A0A8R1EJI6_CAEJA